MGVAEDLVSEIRTLTADMIQAGLCNEQNFPTLKGSGGSAEISFAGASDLSVTLKNIAYGDVYTELRGTRSFNFYMLDGALIQLQYVIRGDEVHKHRLAFFPSPDLTEYQNNPDVYETDEIYADVLVRNIVSVPIRFDFDRGAFREGDHPMSHLTIGQYKNCRIPVGGPLSPYLFLHFILRSFYNTAFRQCSDAITRFKSPFLATITQQEQEHVHVLAAPLVAG